MNIKFVINDPWVHIAKQKSFKYDFDSVPRVGEKLYRHIDGELVMDNSFIVEEVVYIAEEREWYLKHNDMHDPIVVYLKREDQ